MKKEDEDLEGLKQPLTMPVFSWTVRHSGLIEKAVIKYFRL